jgi:hypothetical protein
VPIVGAGACYWETGGARLFGLFIWVVDRADVYLPGTSYGFHFTGVPWVEAHERAVRG